MATDLFDEAMKFPVYAYSRSGCGEYHIDTVKRVVYAVGVIGRGVERLDYSDRARIEHGGDPVKACIHCLRADGWPVK